MLYNSEEIKKILPHRYPFLLVDRIDDIKEEVVNGEKQVVITGAKSVTANEPFFQGHFPNYAVMPGVLILESMAQCGAVYALSKEEFKGKLAFFTGAKNVRWKKQVLPGDVLNLKVVFKTFRQGIGFADAEAYVDGVLACKAEISFAIK